MEEFDGQAQASSQRFNPQMPLAYTQMEQQEAQEAHEIFLAEAGGLRPYDFQKMQPELH